MSTKKPSLLSHYNPQVLWVLMGLNVLVYVAWQLADRNGSELAFKILGENFLVSAPHLFSGRVWTLLTSEFSHIEPRHLLFNMIGLWVFGQAVHQVVRDVLMVHLYVVGAILASLAHVAYGLITGDATPALGASGAVMTFAVVYACLFPKRTLLVFFVIPMPAWVAVLLFLGIDLLGVAGTLNDRVAHMAHLGGAAYGLAFWALWLRKRVTRQPRRSRQ